MSMAEQMPAAPAPYPAAEVQAFNFLLRTGLCSLILCDRSEELECSPAGVSDEERSSTVDDVVELIGSSRRASLGSAALPVEGGGEGQSRVFQLRFLDVDVFSEVSNPILTINFSHLDAKRRRLLIILCEGNFTPGPADFVVCTLQRTRDERVFYLSTHCGDWQQVPYRTREVDLEQGGHYDSMLKNRNCHSETA